MIFLNYMIIESEFAPDIPLFVPLEFFVSDAKEFSIVSYL